MKKPCFLFMVNTFSQALGITASLLQCQAHEDSYLSVAVYILVLSTL